MASDQKRVEFSVLGKVIGTATGWDQMENFALVLYDTEMNDLGRRFVPGFVGPNDLGIDFNTGIVCVYRKEEDLSEPDIRKVDWSVFNE